MQPPAIAAQHPYVYEHLTRTPYAYTLQALIGPSPLLISHGLLKHSVLRSLHHPSSHASSAADDINMRALRACIPLPKRYSVAGSGDVANCFLASKDEGHIPHTVIRTLWHSWSEILYPGYSSWARGLGRQRGCIVGKPWEIESDNFPCFSA